MTAGRPGAGRSVLVGPVRWAEYCAPARSMLLDAGFDLIENPSARPFSREEMMRYAATVDATIAGVERYDAPVLEAMKRARVIARFGVGVDNIDLPVAAANGIEVIRAVGGNAQAVAELALALTLTALRRVVEMDAAVRRGHWDRWVGRELGGSTVGLVGLGAVALAFRELVRGFHVEVLAYDPWCDPQVAARSGVTLVDLDQLAQRADVISIHAPLTPETTHLIDDAFLRSIKPTAVVVNTARGGLVDENAIGRALRHGRVSGYAADVFEQEPVAIDMVLAATERTVLTPHAAADTYESYSRVGEMTARAIVGTFSEEAGSLRGDAL